MKLKIKAAKAEQKETVKALLAIEKLTGTYPKFNSAKSEVNENYIRLVYAIDLDEDEYEEAGKDLLKIGNKVPNWSFTAQIFTTKI